MEDAQYLIDSSGKKKAVLLSIEFYENMLDNLEDLKALIDRNDGNTFSHDDFKKMISLDE